MRQRGIKLRQVDILQWQGQPRIDPIWEVSITEQNYYRWRKRYGGIGTGELKELNSLLYNSVRFFQPVTLLDLPRFPLVGVSI